MAEIKLTANQRKALLASKTQIEEAEREIAKAKRAGLDVSEAEATLAEGKRLRDGLLREYGGI